MIDAYKGISFLTECVLILFSHAKLSNSIDKQYEETEQVKDERTMKFEIWRWYNFEEDNK